MQITLSYWQIEEAVIAYLLQKYGYKIESAQIQDSSVKTTMTTYAYKKNADSEIEFYIEPPSKSSSNEE